MATANLNANPGPLQYRIGQTNRTIGGATAAPNGFSVLNLANGKVFVAQGGVWTDGGTMPFPTSPFDFPQLLATWYATNKTNLNTDGMRPALLEDSSGNITGGSGYRISQTDRVIGGATSAPNGFIVYNPASGNPFVAQNGVWTAGTSMPQDLQTAWLEA